MKFMVLGEKLRILLNKFELLLVVIQTYNISLFITGITYTLSNLSKYRKCYKKNTKFNYIKFNSSTTTYSDC